MSRRGYQKTSKFIAGFSLLLFSFSVLVISTGTALATPSDLADLSMQDLMRLNIRDESLSEDGFRERWSVEYSYRQLRIDGYQMGNNSVGLMDILFTPGEVRTDRNFPVVPTKSTQEVHSFDVGYRVNDKLKLSLSVPLVRQDTDHISSVMGFDAFNVASSGIGDISLLSTWYVPISDSSAWQFSGGISVPTGSIDEMGDTPRAGVGTIEQLPFTKQLGTGTWDLPLSLSYLQNHGPWDFGTQLTARIHLGKNDRDYHLGNRYGINIWAQYFTQSFFHPGVKLAWQHIDAIDGTDVDLLMTGQFPFSNAISNPSFFGGNNINFSLLMKVCNAETNCKKYADLEFTKPVYRNMTGIQPKEDYQFSISFGLKF